jgi:hypothetical protein
LITQRLLSKAPFAWKLKRIPMNNPLVEEEIIGKTVRNT